MGGGLTPLELLVSQLQHSRFPTVICCPEGKEGDLIYEAAVQLDECNVFRGPLEGVVERMVLAANEFDAKSFIRVTGDDLFIDPFRLDRLAASHAEADYTFSDLPKGTESVVVKTDFAQQLIDDPAEDSSEYWDKRRGKAWERASVQFVPLSSVTADEHTFALELDTPDDARTIRDILIRLKEAEMEPPFTVENLAELHNERPFPKCKPPVDIELNQ